VAGWVILAWMPTYLNEHFGLSQGVAGFSATGYFQMSALVGVLVGGYWADRWSRGTELARIFVPALGLCCAALALFAAARAEVLGLALGGLVACGLTRAFTDANMMPILCLVAPERYRATGYGILNFLSCLAGGTMIYVGGAMRDAQIPLGVIFGWSAASLGLCAGVLFWLARTHRAAAP
jgi:sugar phosphate permease